MNEKLQIFSKYLPYGHEIKVKYKSGYSTNLEGANIYKCVSDGVMYLRPMSSLTGDEWLWVFRAGMVEHKEVLNRVKIDKELGVTVFADYGTGTTIDLNFNDPNFYVYTYHDTGAHTAPFLFNYLPFIESLYALHVDIHGAIEKGFAVDKTKIES